jgi:hypothetical protein
LEGESTVALRSVQAVAVHQDGIGGRGHPVERCRFLPGPSESTLCRPGRSGRDFAVGEGAVATARTAGRAGRPSWLRYCNVTFSPGSISQWAACTAAEHRISRWVDRMAAGLTEPRCVSERGLAMAGWRPAERRCAVGGSGKSVARCRARCSRTGSSNPSPSRGESGANSTARLRTFSDRYSG